MLAVMYTPSFILTWTNLHVQATTTTTTTSISYQISGNTQDTHNSYTLGSRSKHATINSDIDISCCCNSNSNSNINVEDNIHTSSTSQILNHINSTSDCCHTIPTQFSTSVKAAKVEEDLANICCYLISQCAPPDLSGNVLTRFISRTG